MKTRLSVAECYKLLNIELGANKAEIKKVFGEFARKNHPDKNTDKTPDEIKKLNEEFIKVKDAYEVLDQYDDSVLCAQAPSDEKEIISGDSSILVPLQWKKKPDPHLKGIPVALANFVIVEGKCPFQEKYKDIWGVDISNSKAAALEAMMNCINKNPQGIKNSKDVIEVMYNFYLGSPWAARLVILEPLWKSALDKRQNLKSPSSSDAEANSRLLESTNLRP